MDTASMHELRTADTEEFFSTTFEHTGSNGKVKKHRKCKLCWKQCILVNETTMLCDDEDGWDVSLLEDDEDDIDSV
ncbi:hypothetical protein BDR07DRAFT_1482003 [Suillus spraguei]|nr:hypothetical protein BDR07DRAFT_1482003 [Suillus spraguei]